MTKRLKVDESGDSDDLQALFDSIASETMNGIAQPTPGAQPAPAVRPAVVTAPAAVVDASGDNDELQALFDAVAAETRQGEEPAPPAAPAAAAAPAQEPNSGVVFNRIGQMARQVHDALRSLGLDSALKEVADVIPDARQRLGYIAQMTEQAASRVLNATDIAKPIQDGIEADAEGLKARWDSLYAGTLTPEEFKVLSADTRRFLDRTVEGTQATNVQLLEIMMAQDFQDLTGQVIKKVVDMAQNLETQLVQVLIEVAPAEVRKERQAGLLNGPVVSSEGRDDVVTSQGQVDDLLESLGF